MNLTPESHLFEGLLSMKKDCLHRAAEAKNLSENIKIDVVQPMI